MSVFKEGVRDFRVGQISNPYPLDSPKGKNWQMGFDKEYFLNLKRVKKKEEGDAKKKENIERRGRGIPAKKVA
jgi:hypothetical protein